MLELSKIRFWSEMINEIVWGDAFIGMKKLPNKCIDLLFADPPYNAKNIGPHAKIYKDQDMQLPLKEYKKFCKNWFKEAKRIAKNILLTPGIANISYYPPYLGYRMA